MAIGRRSFLACIGAALAAPITAPAEALIPAPSVVWVGIDFGCGPAVQSMWIARWGETELELWTRSDDIEEWRRVCRGYSLRLERDVLKEAIDGAQAETRPQAEASAAT